MTSDTPPWHCALAHAIVARSGRTPAALEAELRGIVDDRALDYFAGIVAGVPHEEDSARVFDEFAPSETRASFGIYFTPPELAARMAAHVPPGTTGHAVDLACGDGALLVALGRRAPGVALRGIERDPMFAVAAGAAIITLDGRSTEHDKIVWGDGLALHEGFDDAAVALGNPPYVGEKGNKELFRQLREEHAHLKEYFDARIDLHYLFLHRALNSLHPDGLFIQLTSEYWLSATRAAKLRRHVAAQCAVTTLDTLGQGQFSAAPGHHSFVIVGHKRPTAIEGIELPSEGEIWAPFADRSRLEGTPLGDVAVDRQGFVSGADRVTRKSAPTVDRPPGTPVFLYATDEIPPGREHLFRPLIRRSDCVANRIWLEPPRNESVLWVDDDIGDEEAAQATQLLEPFRPLLEARREATSGKMPWYRIWWPRVTTEYALPKLVVPRRATEAAFCLDLSGAHVSSDCTFILAAPDLDPIPTLLAIMLVANTDEVVEHMRQYEKSKGNVVEFYSDPLRRLPLPVERVGSTLVPQETSLRKLHATAVAKLATEPTGWIDLI